MRPGLTHAQHCARIVEWVQSNPGQTCPAISTALGNGRSRFALILLELCKTGALVRVEISQKQMHYFATQEEADINRPILEAAYQTMRAAQRRAVIEKYEANRVRPSRAKPKVTSYAALDKALLGLCAGPSGLKVEAMMGHTIGKVGDRVIALITAGKVFRGKVSHRVVHYFTTKKAADEWVYAYKGDAPTVSVRASRSRYASGPCIVPAHVRVQRIPHQPGRFDVSLPRGHGQISADWHMARQGIDVRTVVALT